MDTVPVVERIEHLLEGCGVAFERVTHASASSAAEAASARGTPLEIGVKALLVKVDQAFAIFALSAERSLHSNKARRFLKLRRTRFATHDELLRLTGLLPGAVPPFGEPVLPFPLYLDPSVLERDEMVFTAGSRSLSFRLATADYRRIAKAEVFEFSR